MEKGNNTPSAMSATTMDNLMAKAIQRSVLMPAILAAGFLLCLAVSSFGLLDQYVQLVLIYIGINIILALSLNLVNGYMGEFSVGHAGFMSAGAYTAALLTLKLFPEQWGPWIFPLAVTAGGLCSALLGFLVAIPSFKTRGDYLALVTLAFTMIVKSVIENIDALGGARGLPGIDRLTSLPWVFAWTVLAVWIMRNLIYSRFGRGALAIREDELACALAGVRARHVKILVFLVSSFFAGVAGALTAHCIQYINPGMFDVIKSTDVLIMVYLGGVGSVAGSLLGATTYTLLLEVLRPLGVWRMVIMPLMLVLLMIFRPRGIMGMREFSWFIPKAQINPAEKNSPKIKQEEIQQNSMPEQLPRPIKGAPLLEIQAIHCSFGGLRALSDFSLRLDEGELAGIIGPNGAGKTTVFNLITGVYRPDGGSIRIQGTEAAGLSSRQITWLGIARTFQNIRLFNELTVLDNILVARYRQTGYAVPAALLHSSAYRRAEERQQAQALELLDRFGMEELAGHKAGSLPYGMQRRLEIVRALATGPKVLLLDEPAAGMNPNEINRLMELILWIRSEFGVAILLIEHQMRLVMGICERITVLDFGTTIAEGAPEEVRNNPRVLEAYLGGTEESWR